MATTTSKFVTKWNGVKMIDAGAYVSKDFSNFQNAFKREVKNICTSIGANLVSYSKGHYDMSGFIERNGKYVYFSYSNSCCAGGRTCANLTNIGPLYCRTAQHAKDYTGGANHHVPFTEMEQTIDRLLNY